MSHFTTIWLQMIVELIKLASLIITLNKSMACADRVCRNPEGSDSTMNLPGTKLPYRLRKTVTGDAVATFDHVSFSYAGAGAESLIGYQLLPQNTAQTIGIIGGTGSGKSTLVRPDFPFLRCDLAVTSWP